MNTFQPNMRIIWFFSLLGGLLAATPGWASLSPEDSARIEELRRQIHYHDRLYFREANPEISDHEYDQLVRELEQLESRGGEQANAAESDEPGIGDDRLVGFRKSAHFVHMLSLEKCYSPDEVENWLQELSEHSASEETSVIVEPKVDGLAVSLVYENGCFVRALTRGNGREGDDITASVLAMGGFPLNIEGGRGTCGKLPLPDRVELRGEIYLPLSRFEEINKERREQELESFKTPRNLAAGTIRLDNPESIRSRGLKVILFAWGEWEPLESQPASQIEFLEMIEEWGLPCIRPLGRIQFRDGSIPSLPYKQYKEHLSSLDMPTDGLVLKADSLSLRNALGIGSRSPNWAVAYKFKPESASTIVREIVFDVGRTGVLAPVAEFDPVELDGRTISRASLHNPAFIKRMDIREGDRVRVELRGHTIPILMAVQTGLRGADSRPFTPPADCPGCGCSLPSEGRLRCGNPACPPKRLKQILHLIQSAGVKGMGPVSCKALMEGLADRAELLERNWKKEDLLNLGLNSYQAASMARFLADPGNIERLRGLLEATGGRLSSAGREGAARTTSQ